MKMSENCTQMSLFPEMEESISSLVASPARTFRLQEIRKELRQREVDSFSRLPGSPTRSSPIAELDPRFCWRTSQTSLLETGEVGQEPYMGSWPSEGIVLNGKLWEQPMWGHLTGGSDGGQSVTWPTPTASKNGPGKDLNNPRGIHQGNALATAVQMWPTPVSSSSIACTMKAARKEAARLHPRGQETLATRMAVRWPTPRATEYKGGKNQGNNGKNRKESSDQYPFRCSEGLRGRTIERGLGGMVDGIPDWLDEPGDIPRVTTGQKNRVSRLKGLGNAVVPQCAMIPLMRLKEILT